MKTALVQMASGPDKEENIRKATGFACEAFLKGARFVCFPEYFYFRGPLKTAEEVERVCEPLNGPTVGGFAALATANKAYILLGSIYERANGRGRAYNTSVLLDPKGEVRAVYRKKNLFHVRLPGAEVRESDIFNAGTTATLTKVGPFTLGMAMCFDVRFPAMFEAYARKGANLFTVPASFSHATGQAHWEILVRARAVETFSYVLAPNQTGINAQGLPCWGQSMIVDPWGRILALATTDREEIVYASLDIKEPRSRRRMFPGYKDLNGS